MPWGWTSRVARCQALTMNRSVPEPEDEYAALADEIEAAEWQVRKLLTPEELRIRREAIMTNVKFARLLDDLRSTPDQI